MSDLQAQCSYVVDCSGLHEIARTKSGNLLALYLDQLDKGVIAVPTCVWKEFCDIYEEYVSVFDSITITKINLNLRYRTGAARLADKLNSSFSISPYDSQADLYTAAIATHDEIQVLTAASRLKYYENMECDAQDLTTWAEQLD